MKSTSAALRGHLDEELTTLAHCWRLTRVDGQVFRFTDHDRDIALPGSGGGTATVLNNATSPAEIRDAGLTYYLPAPPPDDTEVKPADSDTEYTAGRHFYEVTKNDYPDGTSYDLGVIGIAKPGWVAGVSGLTGINGYFGAALAIYKEDGTFTSTAVGDTAFPSVIGVGFDGAANTVTFWVNGVLAGTVPTTAGQPYRPWIGGLRSSSFNPNATEIRANFGSEPFAYPIAGWEGAVWGEPAGPGPVEIFKAGTGFTRSAIQNSADLSADNLDVEGLLEDASLKPEEIRAGLFDGARVDIMLVNWAEPSMGVVKLRRGTLGNVIQTTEGTFTGELRGLTQRLSQTIGEVYQPECRRTLGDFRCRVDLVPFTTHATITAVTSRKVFKVAYTDPQVVDDWFNGGRALFTSGDNGGRAIEVKDFRIGDGTIELFLAAPFMPEIGDTVDLVPGCDGRRTTCKEVFDNYLNFRGEPFIPGVDELLRYPDAAG